MNSALHRMLFVLHSSVEPALAWRTIELAPYGSQASPLEKVIGPCGLGQALPRWKVIGPCGLGQAVPPWKVIEPGCALGVPLATERWSTKLVLHRLHLATYYLRMVWLVEHTPPSQIGSMKYLVLHKMLVLHHGSKR